ncbi:MAG: protein BatD [Elusimicrobia bacterium]|nr:protein BatD [Elusimicrobiota bacterium]
MKAALLAVCAAFSAAAPAAAADLSVSATLSARSAAPGDQLVLSVSISGSGSAAPKLPLIPDVEIYESGKSQSLSIINGRVSSSVLYTYILAPRKAGRFVVPPIEVPGAAPTEPIEFSVGAAQSPPPAAPQAEAPAPAPRPAGAPDAFVTAALDKNRALVNEQVTLVVRFHTAVSLLGAPQYDAPKLTGLLSENLGAEGQGTTVIGGRTYHFSEVKSALFPVQAGRAAISPAIVTVQLPRRVGGMGDDFFDRFFGMAAPESRRLQTEPLSLQADPLPSGAPEDFCGIVGSLTVASAVDRARLRAGEALNLTVTVSGVGNIKSLPEPKRPDLPSVRFFDSENSVKLERLGDKMGGAKTFKMVVVPRVSGPLEIPPLTVSYYDPAKRAYVRAQSKPIRLDILPGDPNAAPPVAGPGAEPAPGVTAVAADIRYLKAPGGRFAPGDALAAFGTLGPWHALPAAFLLAALLIDLRRRSHAADPRGRRARAARAAAERRLQLAEAQPAEERARAVALLGEALTGYFADKLHQPAAGLTLKAALLRLQDRKTPPPAAELARLRSIWDELDLLRYAPGGAGQAEVKRLAGEIRALTLAFDKELRS